MLILNIHGQTVRITKKSPTFKSDAEFADDAQACINFAKKNADPTGDTGVAFTACMVNFDNIAQMGNTIFSKEATERSVYSSPQPGQLAGRAEPVPESNYRPSFASPPTSSSPYTPSYIPSSPQPSVGPSSASPTQYATSPNSNSSTSAAVHFRSVVEANEDIIFLAAHPSAQIDNRSIAILRSNSDSAVITYRVAWRGPKGKNFETTLSFAIEFDGKGTIGSVNIQTEETNNPFPPAFFAADMAKQAILSYAREKMKSTSGKVAMGIFNSNTSVKGGVELLLLRLANN